MIVADASFALKLVLVEEDSRIALELWRDWVEQGEEIVAPRLFRAETMSGVRRRHYRRLLTQEQAEAAYSVLDGLEIDLLEPSDTYGVARRFAEEFNRPNIYASCCLALAEIAGGELWTADRRLANAIGMQLPWVNLLGSR